MDKSPALKAVSDVEVPVAVKLAETTMSLEEILALRPGSTLSFPQETDVALKLEVDGVALGEGYAVERAGQLGLQLEKLQERSQHSAENAGRRTE